MESENKANYVEIPVDGVILEGNLAIPKDAKGIVIFAHGSGSSRFSPRNRFVADELQEKGLSTLLIDLLTKDEERVDQITREFRFDIRLLFQRLMGVTRWIKQNNITKTLNVGYFGSSTGAAAALIAAALQPKDVKSVVSRGGRTDLAENFVSKVNAPTLLIVGSYDTLVISVNRKTLNQLDTKKKLEIVSGASHLFEEPGKLEIVAELASRWFKEYLE